MESFRKNLSEGIFLKQLYDPTGRFPLKDSILKDSGFAKNYFLKDSF
jgi:hypothetical protein